MSNDKPLTKSELLGTIAEDTGLTRPQVNSVITSLEAIIEQQLGGRNAPGQISLFGLLKISKLKKPPKPARKGRNPFTGEEMMFKAKPASTAVKIRPLKRLKEMV